MLDDFTVFDTSCHVMSESMAGSIIYSLKFLKIDHAVFFVVFFSPYEYLHETFLAERKSSETWITFLEVYETIWSSHPSLRMWRCLIWSRNVERVSRSTISGTFTPKMGEIRSSLIGAYFSFKWVGEKPPTRDGLLKILMDRYYLFISFQHFWNQKT